MEDEVIAPHRIYNVCPTTRVFTVYLDKHDKVQMRQMWWDLRRSWTKETPKEERGEKEEKPAAAKEVSKDETKKKPKKPPLFNLTAKLAKENPFFNRMLLSQRCLLVVDGFNEWDKYTKERFPYRFVRKNSDLIGIGGIYNTKKLSDGRTGFYATLMTTFPNRLIRKIHDRQPIILPPEKEALWLDPATKYKDFEDYLAPSDPLELEYYPVSKKINKTFEKVGDKNIPLDSPDLIVPIGKVVALAA